MKEVIDAWCMTSHHITIWEPRHKLHDDNALFTWMIERRIQKQMHLETSTTVIHISRQREN